MDALRIGLIGDYQPEVPAHVAIPRALALAAQTLACSVEQVWIATPSLAEHPTRQLSVYDALWCVPGSPYTSMDGALRAVRFAREHDLSFLGTCGGFQHALIEYARDVLGLAEADHAESNAAATMPLIAPLACSLVGEQGVISLRLGSRIHAIYGRSEVIEQYHCSFGLNPHYQSLLQAGQLRITGTDEHGEARVVELASHPFFIATLYQPERSALRADAQPHPLVTAFLHAALARHGATLPNRVLA